MRIFNKLLRKNKGKPDTTEVGSELLEDELLKVTYTICGDEIFVDTDIKFLTDEEDIKTQVTLLFYMFTAGFRELVYQSLRGLCTDEHSETYLTLLLENVDKLIEEYLESQRDEDDSVIYPSDVLK